MDVQDLAMTAGRAVIVYVFTLVLVRLLGKREIGSLGAFDFLVALMIGEMVDEPIFGSTTLTKGLVAIGVVGLLHFLSSWASFKFKLIDRLTEAGPTVLVEDGQIKDKAMAKERMTEQDLWSALRLQSIDDLNEVKTATLEPDGQVSVIKQEWARELQKGDLHRQMA